MADWLATEQLADRTSEGVGGLFNATFGNAAELIIALAALRAGLPDVVKASIAGSNLGNMLLLGAAMLAGDTRYKEQQFKASAARSEATLLMLAAIALVMPAAYNALVAEYVPGGQAALSVSISIVLLVMYGLFLLFSLRTHAALFAETAHDGEEEGGQPAQWSLGGAVAVLDGSKVGIAWFNNIFIGVFVIAVLGNAAEHATAVTAALKNRMDLSLSIAIGSSCASPS